LISRRAALQGIGALGAGALFAPESSLAQAARSQRRIDVHHHFFSDSWLKTLNGLTEAQPVMGIDVMRKYSIAQSLELMDQANVETAYLSITTPGIWYGDIAQTRRLARELNEFAARMVADHKGRYGLFAVLPLPDVDASLREIEYAFDTLKADGVGLISSYDGKWLGDYSFAPIWEELNRRNAVVFTHATAPRCCWGNFVPGVHPTMVELSSDLARTIANLIQSGTANRTPNVKYIWSHGGGTIFSARFIGSAGDGDVLNKPAPPNSKLYHLRRFYYDTASAADQIHMQLVNMVVSTSQILYGTDVPWGNPASIGKELEKCSFNAAQFRAIEYENARRLLPKPRGA
jgi:predicted TIM-barrel fold metal-dependent hydrolase